MCSNFQRRQGDTAMNKKIIAKVQSFGFDVYMRNPERDTWLLFTDGKRIGYLQYLPMEGFTLSTVHKPNKTTGTGIQVKRHAEDFNKEDLERCFELAPGWLPRDGIASITKWRDIDEYRSANSFNVDYRLVPPVTEE